MRVCVSLQMDAGGSVHVYLSVVCVCACVCFLAVDQRSCHICEVAEHTKYFP